ncbi:hypothetical protein KKA15_06235 [Patescibacteria group bacterium]|nr:hypothetical protein [Patescibacteria group bacterium]
MHNTSNTIFSEKVEFMRILLLAMVIPGLLMIFLPLFLQPQEGFPKVILPIIGIILLLLAYASKTLDITLTDEQLIFGYSKMKSKVNLSDIKETRIEDFKFRNFGGYGIRIGRMNKKKVVGYIPKGGKGLFIKNVKHKNYFIISNRAEELQSLINDRIKILKKKRPDEHVSSPGVEETHR